MIGKHSKIDINKLYYGLLVKVEIDDNEFINYTNKIPGIFYKMGINKYYNLCDNKVYSSDMKFCISESETIVYNQSLIKLNKVFINDEKFVNELNEECKLVLKSRIK